MWELDILLLQYKLWQRRIIKLENNLDFYEDSYLVKLIKRYSLENKIQYIRYTDFILFWWSKEEIDEYIQFNWSKNIQDRVIKTSMYLWYPECCVKKYYQISLKLWDSLELDQLYLKEGEYLYKWFHIMHMPCSRDCKITEKIYQELIDYIEQNGY